ncbi:MAG TPA: glycoside hydrolase domain-containing protein, partial [Polyangia bacterium]
MALVASTAARAGQGAPVVARAVGPMAQVFPSTVPAGEPEAKLEAARGEWEPFQIVVHASGGALHGVRAEATALGGAGALAAPRLYRVEYLDVKTPSSVEGHAGPWPDALVPDVDAFAGEKRRAFPFDVPAGEARAIWVELFVPASAAPGGYRGAVRVSAEGRAPTTIPVELVVHKFTLPKSSSLPVTFGFAAGAVATAHPGLSPAATAQLVEAYERSLLRHRISAHGGSNEPAPWRTVDGKLAIDWTPYDAEVAPFLDGTADRGGPADGARWSAIDFRVPEKLHGAERADYQRQLAAHLAARGWLDRAFDYTWDEPPEDKLAEVRRRADELHRAVPTVPRLVTRVLDPRLVGAVDIWCPIVNLVDDKPGNSQAPARAAYDERLRRGERLWWYQACMSHGCNIVGGRYFTGWPSYAIDAPAMSHRIFEWLTFR